MPNKWRSIGESFTLVLLQILYLLSPSLQPRLLPSLLASSRPPSWLASGLPVLSRLVCPLLATHRSSRSSVVRLHRCPARSSVGPDQTQLGHQSAVSADTGPGLQSGIFGVLLPASSTALLSLASCPALLSLASCSALLLPTSYTGIQRSTCPAPSCQLPLLTSRVSPPMPTAWIVCFLVLPLTLTPTLQ